MITRHFYRVEEVQAALLYAIHRGRPREAAFWCEELIATELFQEAWAILVEAWLFYALPTDPTWIQGRVLTYESDDIHQACYRLVVARKDNSLWAVLLQTEMPDRVGPCSLGAPYENLLDAYLCAAIAQGKGACAWWAYKKSNGSLGHRIPETGLNVLLEACNMKCPVVAQCASVLLACCMEIHTEIEPVPLSLQKDILQWRSITLNRKYRIYSIPVECLYGRTERGRSPQSVSTIEEVRRVDDLILQTNSFWRKQKLLWDADIDAFYDKFFPDDIPDEWNWEDPHKSHGPGVLRKGETLSLSKVGRIWMTHSCQFVWGFKEWPESCEPRIGGTLMECGSLNDMEDVDDKLLQPVRLVSAMPRLSLEVSETLSLKPVHKRLMIV